MEFFGKDKLARLAEEQLKRRQDRADEAVRRLQEIGRQTMDASRYVPQADLPAAGEQADTAEEQRPGRLSRVLLEAASESTAEPRRSGDRKRKSDAKKGDRKRDGKRDRKRGAADPASLEAEGQRALRQIDQAMAMVQGVMADATGAGLRGGLEAASQQVTQAVSQVSAMAPSAPGAVPGAPQGAAAQAAPANPLADLLQQEADEERASQAQAAEAERGSSDADGTAAREGASGEPSAAAAATPEAGGSAPSTARSGPSFGNILDGISAVGGAVPKGLLDRKLGGNFNLNVDKEGVHIAGGGVIDAKADIGKQGVDAAVGVNAGQGPATARAQADVHVDRQGGVTTGAQARAGYDDGTTSADAGARIERGPTGEVTRTYDGNARVGRGPVSVDAHTLRRENADGTHTTHHDIGTVYEQGGVRAEARAAQDRDANGQVTRDYTATARTKQGPVTLDANARRHVNADGTSTTHQDAGAVYEQGGVRGEARASRDRDAQGQVTRDYVATGRAKAGPASVDATARRHDNADGTHTTHVEGNAGVKKGPASARVHAETNRDAQGARTSSANAEAKIKSGPVDIGGSAHAERADNGDVTMGAEAHARAKAGKYHARAEASIERDAQGNVARRRETSYKLPGGREAHRESTTTTPAASRTLAQPSAPAIVTAQPVSTPPARTVSPSDPVVTQPSLSIEASAQSANAPALPPDATAQIPAATTPQRVQAPSSPMASAPSAPAGSAAVAPLPAPQPAPSPAPDPTLDAARAGVGNTRVAAAPANQPAAAPPRTTAAPSASAGPAPAPQRAPGASAVDVTATPAAAPTATQIPTAPLAPGATAPQTPTISAPDPEVALPRAAGDGAVPDPASMLPSSISLGDDRQAAQRSLAAEAQTGSRVGVEARQQKASQLDPLAPQLDQVRQQSDPSLHQLQAQGQAQGASAAAQSQGREAQAADGARQQIAATAQAAATAPSAVDVFQQARDAFAAPARAISEALAAMHAMLRETMASMGGTAAVSPAATTRAAQAAGTPSDLPAFDAAVFQQLDQRPQLAPLQAQPVEQGRATAAATYQQAGTQIEQLSAIPAPRVQAPSSADASATTQGGYKTREAAIAQIEQDVVAQLNAQGPAKMQEAAAVYQGQLRANASAQQQQADHQAATQLADHQAQDQAVRAEQPPITGAQAAAEAQPPYEAYQQHATQASVAMQGEIAAAQATATTAVQAAEAQRNQSTAQAQQGYEHTVRGELQPQLAAAQQQASQQLAQDQQAAQQRLVADQQQARAIAEQQQAQAQARAEAEIHAQHAQLAQQQAAAQTSHAQQVAAASAQHAAEVQQAQLQADQQVQQHQSDMQGQVSGEQARGQQEADRHLGEGERGYQAEIQRGQQQANTERQRAEAEAADKQRQADAEKSRSVVGQVASWVTERISDLVNAAKAALAAARDLVVRIMQSARQAALSILARARAAARAALASSKSRIQGIIASASAAIRWVIRTSTQLIRNVIRNLQRQLQAIVARLTQVLTHVISMYRDAVGAIIEGAIAAASLIDRELGESLRVAADSYRADLDRALARVVTVVQDAGQAIEARIQTTAAAALEQVAAAEHTLDEAVAVAERTMNEAVDRAYERGAGLIESAFDRAAAVVDRAYERASATVTAFFERQMAALDVFQAGVNRIADFVVSAADRVLDYVASVAEAVVDLIPDAWTKAFVDFWNGSWRSTIIVGLAVVAAVAITMATGGLGGPVAAVLLAGVLGGSLAGGAYFGGELLAREGQIHLTEQGKGMYVPGFGNVQLGPDGKPVPPAGLSPEQLAEFEKSAAWAASNFNLQRDERGQVTGYDRKSGSEIGGYAVREGVQGFGEGFIGASMAMGGQLLGVAAAGTGLVARVGSTPLARQMFQQLVVAGVSGVTDVGSSALSAGWNAAFEALEQGKDPAQAWAAGWKASADAGTSVQAWTTALVTMGIAPAKVKFLEPALEELGGRIAHQGLKSAVNHSADILSDTFAETMANAGGAFAQTYAEAVKQGASPAEAIARAQAAANQAFSSEAITQSLAMNSAGALAYNHAETVAARRAARKPGAAAGPDAGPAPARTSGDEAVTAAAKGQDATPSHAAGPDSVDAGQLRDLARAAADPENTATQAAKARDHVPSDQDPGVERGPASAVDRTPGEPAGATAPAAPRRKVADADIDRQIASGHAGIEVHSHFMGNVDPKTFRAVIQESGLAPMRAGDPNGRTPSERVGDTTSWEPVLREIAELKQHAHQYQRDASGALVTDPSTGKPVVAQRGVSGDAIEQVRIAQGRIDKLKAQLLDPKLSPRERQRIKDRIYREARSAAEKALRASDETDFNSSYEVRDELVKKFYGAKERRDALGGQPHDTSIVAAEAAFREHFKDRPAVLDRISAAVEAQRSIDQIRQRARDEGRALTAAEQTSIRDLGKQAQQIHEQFAYDAYAKDTVLRLAQDNIRYTEQSNSAKKLGQRFDPEQLAAIKQQLIAEHPELRAQLEAIEIKHVTMINTDRFGLRDPGVDRSDVAVRDRVSDADFDKELGTLVKQTSRRDVVGVDIAGAEHFAFTADEVGPARLAKLYQALRTAARDRGEPIVLRPHVGEGANDVVAGKHFGRDTDRQLVSGEPSHYQRARANLDGMLAVFESMAGPDGKLPPEVIVRFGHATHTTPDQAARMARLGIIAEVNLQSNVETGSVAQRKPTVGPDGQPVQDRARGKDEKLPLHQVNPERRVANLDDHALATLLFNDVPVILSTDAHSVMSTNLGNEYRKAKVLIDAVLAGSRGVPMTADQARGLGAAVDPETPSGATVTVFRQDLSGDGLATFDQKFTDAYRKLYEAANDYYVNRPKQGDASPLPGAASDNRLTVEDLQRAMARPSGDALRDKALAPDIMGPLATPEGLRKGAELPPPPPGMIRLADGTLARASSDGVTPEARAWLAERRAARAELAGAPRKVVVDGGGPAGALTALQAFHLGHDVTIVEMRDAATLPVLWSNRAGSMDVLQLIDPVLAERIAASSGTVGFYEHVDQGGERTGAVPAPHTADADHATGDPRQIASGSSTWMSQNKTEVNLIWDRLSELAAAEASNAQRENREPRLKLMRGYEVKQLPVDGDRRGVVVQKIEQQLHKVDATGKPELGPDGKPITRPYVAGEAVPDGYKVVRATDGKDIALGTPDDLFVADGAGSKARKMVGSESVDVGPSAQYIAGYFDGTTLQSSPDADGNRLKGGARITENTARDGTPLHAVASSGSHLDGTWALPEVDPALDFKDPASIEAYFGRPMSAKEATLAYYKQEVAKILEVSPAEIRDDAFVFGPAAFTLQSHVSSPVAADASNVHLVGDARGNSHFLASLGKVTGTGTHQMAIRQYYQALGWGLDPDVARALLDRRLDAGTRVWLKSGLPSFTDRASGPTAPSTADAADVHRGVAQPAPGPIRERAEQGATRARPASDPEAVVINLGGEGEVKGAIDLNLLEADATRFSPERIRDRSGGKLVQADMVAMPFGADSVDSVFGNAVPALPNLVASMPTEAFRVLKPGGTIMIWSTTGGELWLGPLAEAGFTDVRLQGTRAIGVKPLPVEPGAGADNPASALRPASTLAPELRTAVDRLQTGQSLDLGQRGGKDGLLEYLRHAPVEYGVFRDAEGNQYVMRGGVDELSPRSPGDRLIAHNHPGGTAHLSPEDVSYIAQSSGGRQRSTLLSTPGEDGGIRRERVRDYEPAELASPQPIREPGGKLVADDPAFVGNLKGNPEADAILAELRASGLTAAETKAALKVASAEGRFNGVKDLIRIAREAAAAKRDGRPVIEAVVTDRDAVAPAPAPTGPTVDPELARIVPDAALLALVTKAGMSADDVKRIAARAERPAEIRAAIEASARRRIESAEQAAGAGAVAAAPTKVVPVEPGTTQRHLDATGFDPSMVPDGAEAELGALLAAADAGKLGDQRAFADWLSQQANRGETAFAKALRARHQEL